MADTPTARSLLFVPGDRPERFAKAAGSGTDAVILDLEDAVASADKPAARDHVRRFLDTGAGGTFLLRINAVDSAHHGTDLPLAQHPALAGVVLPKAALAALNTLSGQLPHPIWPLIETAQGLAEARRIAALPQSARMLLGTIDLSLELGLDMTHPGGRAMLDQARFQLVCAARLAGAAAPLDGVFPALSDDAGLQQAAEHAAAAGMGGMMCIHPKQLETIHRAFGPTPAQLDWARAVLAASKGQPRSFAFQGEMVDQPVLERARRMLDA